MKRTVNGWIDAEDLPATGRAIIGVLWCSRASHRIPVTLTWDDGKPAPKRKRSNKRRRK